MTDWRLALEIGGIAFAIISSLLADKWQGKKLAEENQNQWIKLHEMEKWQSIHDKESADRRLGLELKIATLYGTTGTLDEKMDSIGKKLDGLIAKFERYSERMDK